ncbi:MAG: hypothetical protein EOO41_02110 [Methanobacteriota archaeon]|nr:MAG: hypothetical protein EOO41_02110 [Euryarchaeota archaeon]
MDYQNIGKDRSLGYVEVKASDFVMVNEGDEQYPYTSKGVFEREDRIKLDKNNTYKGSLIYQAEFKPGLSMKGGVSFEAPKNELVAAVEEAREGGGG